MKEIQGNVVIVGSGAGGATIARELAGHVNNVLILEKGNGSSKQNLIKKGYIKYNQGILINSIYNKIKKLITIDNNLTISSRIGIGGTTINSSANAVRSLENELYSLGISIKDEFKKIEQELNVTLFPQNRMGRGAKKIWDAANSLGFKFQPIPKFIDFNKCIDCCNKCNVKCPTNAKWTAVNFIRKAQDNGASLVQNVMVNKVITSNGNVVGLKALSTSGEIFIRANVVVLAAGAIETPIILQKSGIETAGKKLFCDPCYVVYAPCKNDSFNEECRSIINSEFLHKDGFTLLNCIVQPRNKKYCLKFMKTESEEKMLGVMIKIKDDPTGEVHSDGSIRKIMTSNDLCKLNAGVQIAKEILKKAGVDHRYIKIHGSGGPHPGGTAAIGDVVDQNQETEVKNLFVSDASVLPTSPGLPPILTIIALSKRLAKKLTTMI